MKRALLCLVAVSVVGCSTFSNDPSRISDKNKSFEEYKEAKFEYPEWYLTPPREDDAIIAAATEVSTDLQFAIDKATLSAQREIAFKLKNSMNQKFTEHSVETNYSKSDSTSKMHERVTIAKSEDVNLVGVQRLRTVVIKEGNKYRCFTLVRYGLDESNKIHMNYMVKERRANAKKEIENYNQELKENATTAGRPSDTVNN